MFNNTNDIPQPQPGTGHITVVPNLPVKPKK